MPRSTQKPSRFFAGLFRERTIITSTESKNGKVEEVKLSMKARAVNIRLLEPMPQAHREEIKAAAMGLCDVHLNAAERFYKGRSRREVLNSRCSRSRRVGMAH